MKLPSNSVHSFARVPNVAIERSQFDRSRAYKTTFDSGYLIPVFFDEVLPGDTYNVRSNYFARLATPIKPLMDNMYFETQSFFCPSRLLWTDWEHFNGAQDNPGDSTAFTIPQVPLPIGGAPVGTLHNYLGVPAGTGITGTFTVNALPSRMYNLVYNTWYRDENQQNSVTVDKGAGPDTLANYVLKRRGKRFDYFTSCLPWPQKGSAVTIPAGASSAPVNRVSNAGSWHLFQPGTNTPPAVGALSGQLDGGGPNVGVYGGSANLMSLDPNGGLIADLSSAFATTINALRLAEQTQVLLERDARGGTRYIEILKSHFGVTSPDARLQRPEYLGGGSSPVNLHPVPQTGATGASGTTTPQGNLGGFGTVGANGHGFNKSFVEHGYVMTLASVRADLTYQQGLDRIWSRSTRYDFFWPALAHIGEQAVLNKEIFLTGTGSDASAFGYIPRYDEYRFGRSLITGKFASTYATPLDYWHLSQLFGSLPALGDTFISENPPIARVIAVPSEPQFLLDSFHSVKCARPIPVNGVPGLGSRF